MSQFEVTIREAIPGDAAELAVVSRQIGQETDFLTMDETGLALPVELLAEQIADIYESENNLLLVALIDEQIVGLASVKADNSPRVAHIGEVGISILQDFWRMGLGTVLLEEVLTWAAETGIIRRLELTVQVRNTAAIKLYEKMGFTKEAVLSRGARTDQGEFLDIYLMSLLID